MRLIILDLPGQQRVNFYPLALSRPIWELRFGMTTLADKLVAASGASEAACFVPPYMADAYREQTTNPVNDTDSLQGDDLLLVDARVKAENIESFSSGPTRAVFDADGSLQLAYVSQQDIHRLIGDSIDGLIASLKELSDPNQQPVSTWNYTWELVLENGPEITRDFARRGQHGVSGKAEEPFALRGSESDVYVAPSAVIHPMVVIDAEHGPVYLDEGVEIHPFTRIEGPCYVGPKTILLGAKCREGNTIGPVCRVGGEIEESIIHGYSNKYHDGFLGHAYVGEWVNLGAQTSNSDLKNDYSNVAVSLDSRTTVDTGSRKVGALIGDHAKTSIGTLFNTGSYVGAMTLIAATGKPLPKHICSFAWFLEGVTTKGFGKRKLYETAKTVMGRRGREWTDAQESMWDAVFELTADARRVAVKKGRKAMKSKLN